MSDNVLDRLPQGAKVAVLRLRSLGDCVLTTPAIALLKQARPDVRIAVVVEDAFRAVFSDNPDIDKIVRPSAFAIVGWRPEMIVNLHGGPTSDRLTLLSGARVRVGFAHYRMKAVYNVRVPTAQEVLGVERKVHTAEHLASMMFYLGVPISEVPRARLFAKPWKSARPYAVVHPLASAPGKTWRARNFLEVADQLRSRFDLDPIFIAGPQEDLEPFADYSCLAGASLEKLKSVLAGASLFVGNDSGPAHMAAAFGVPSVVLFGASDHEVWRPWRTDAVTLVGERISKISASSALDAVAELLVGQPR
jgi:heptosyltransferase-3